MTDTNQIIASLAQEAKPVKALPGPGALFLAWLAASGLYACLLMAFSGVRADLAQSLRSPLFTAELGALLLILITSALAASVLAYPDLHQKRRLVFAPLPPLLLFALIVALEWMRDNPPAPSPAHGVECLACIALYACAPAALMIFLMRRRASTHYYMAGATALLAAASVGCLALRLVEKTDSIRHLVFWHYLPILGGALMGVLLGRRFLKW